MQQASRREATEEQCLHLRKKKSGLVSVCVCRGDEEREGERERNSLPTKKCGNEIFENYQNTIFVVMI